jgi:CHRD domain
MRLAVRGYGAAFTGMALLAATAVPAAAEAVRSRLSGYQEVPPISTEGGGTFRARISNDGSEIDYVLTYGNLSSNVTQAHLHFGQKGVAAPGNIIVFLCTNLGNGTPGTPACPPGGGEVTGTVTAEDVIGPAGQGIAPGEFDELVAAIRAGAVYVNVHTSTFPAGEIRGQVKGSRRHE